MIDKRTVVTALIVAVVIAVIYYSVKAVNRNRPEAKVKPMYEEPPEAIPMDIHVDAITNTDFLNLTTSFK